MSYCVIITAPLQHHPLVLVGSAPASGAICRAWPAMRALWRASSVGAAADFRCPGRSPSTAGGVLCGERWTSTSGWPRGLSQGHDLRPPRILGLADDLKETPCSHFHWQCSRRSVPVTRTSPAGEMLPKKMALSTLATLSHMEAAARKYRNAEILCDKLFKKR